MLARLDQWFDLVYRSFIYTYCSELSNMTWGPGAAPHNILTSSLVQAPCAWGLVPSPPWSTISPSLPGYPTFLLPLCFFSSGRELGGGGQELLNHHATSMGNQTIPQMRHWGPRVSLGLIRGPVCCPTRLQQFHTLLFHSTKVSSNNCNLDGRTLLVPKVV